MSNHSGNGTTGPLGALGEEDANMLSVPCHTDTSAHAHPGLLSGFGLPTSKLGTALDSSSKFDVEAFHTVMGYSTTTNAATGAQSHVRGSHSSTDSAFVRQYMTRGYQTSMFSTSAATHGIISGDGDTSADATVVGRVDGTGSRRASMDRFSVARPGKLGTGPRGSELSSGTSGSSEAVSRPSESANEPPVVRSGVYGAGVQSSEFSRGTFGSSEPHPRSSESLDGAPIGRPQTYGIGSEGRESSTGPTVTRRRTLDAGSRSSGFSDANDGSSEPHPRSNELSGRTNRFSGDGRRSSEFSAHTTNSLRGYTRSSDSAGHTTGSSAGYPRHNDPSDGATGSSDGGYHRGNEPSGVTTMAAAGPRNSETSELTREQGGRSHNIEALDDSSSATHAMLMRSGIEPSNQRTSGSPQRKRQRIDADRFIPQRSGRDLLSTFHLIPPRQKQTAAKGRPRSPSRGQRSRQSDDAEETWNELLRAEVFQDTVPASQRYIDDRLRTPPKSTRAIMSPPSKNMFTYVSPRDQALIGLHTPKKTPQRAHNLTPDPRLDVYNTTPISYVGQQILSAPRPQHRTIAKVPVKVLDAPDLAEDFYLNLMDWSSTDVLAVGLGRAVYMYNAQNNKVAKLCYLDDDRVTSVSWIQKGTHLAVGTKKGLVQIWDCQKFKRLRTMTGHVARVGSLAWNSHILSTGSRDTKILHRDVRVPDQWVGRLLGHKQEVCGLKWNCRDGQLASGSNDNTVLVWDKVLDARPLHTFTQHVAAVKALAWSPHQRGLLASGGGTADRRIIFHDTIKGDIKNDIDTGSQVCNLMWSKNSNELVSTHGYIQNNLVIWKYPSMTRVASLTGHTYRVLYLAMSPDGTQVVTGAGDETLRFWDVFKPKPAVKLLGSSIDLPPIR